MTKQRKPPAVDSHEVHGLLRQYACPVPYHEVRTRFFGNTANSELSESPLEVVKNLWRGALPEFESIEELNRLINALINGLWNALTIHQKRSEPFRLDKVQLEPSVANLAKLALVRRQEIDGFVEGLFGGSEKLYLSERANKSLGVLAEMRTMLAGAHDLATREVEAANPGQITETFRHLRKLTRIMETEVHSVVIDCTRARRQMLQDAPSRRRTFH